MGAIFQSLGRTIVAGIVVLIVLLIILAAMGARIALGEHGWWLFAMRWLHITAGVMWIGLLWYFNFVQTPSMPKIPDEQKPAISKVIAPAALFVALLGWFGHPDLGPVLSGFSGVALMAAGLAAVGVLASSLTESQPVAAGLAAFVGVLLWFARGGPDVVGTGGLLAYLSLSERLRAFAAGVIDTGDIGFYVTAVAGALVVAALVTDGRRVAR